MEEKLTYIEQETVEDALFTRLQEHTLDELERLSGNVWTDFNVHDPGVTVADAANYVLTEADYKLGFDLPDYLADKEGKIGFKTYGLFPPEEVYTTAPVTAEDYRKLFIVQFPDLDDIQVEADPKTGNYNVRLVKSPFQEGEENVEKEIRCFYHAHRNLCENIGNISVVSPEQLVLYAELEIETGYNATDILAKVYWTIIQYLSGSIEIAFPEERLTSGLSPEQWMEGTTEGVRVTIPVQADTEHELYLKFFKIKGIKAFKTCYLKENGKIRTDFKSGYSLSIPRTDRELHVSMTVGQSEAPIDMARFVEEVQALYYTRGASLRREKQASEKPAKDNPLPIAVYRDIYSYYPIGMDLPDCYLTHLSEAERALPIGDRKLRQFDAYLALYDLLIERGLKEVKEMTSLFSIAEDVSVLSNMEVLTPETLAVGKKNDRYRNVFALKNKYLDFLDGLYGVDSNPLWMEEMNYYGETEDEQLLRRIAFLRHAAALTGNRAGARNICEAGGEENVPTVKKYFCCLLGMNRDEEISVGNVLPSHNLALFGDDPRGERVRNRLNAVLISEKMLDDANIQPVILTPSWEDKETKLQQYTLLRNKLAVFNSNVISGGFFRGGIRLDNYKLVKADENEYLLVFWNEEENQWMNLERSNDKDKLNELANTLRRYLRELNRLCETVYVMEHNLLSTPEPFTVSFVFPTWTARFKSLRFREICGQLVRSLIPPHLKARLYWLDISDMQLFEKNYRLWRKVLANEMLPRDREEIEQNMLSALEEAKKKEQAENEKS